MLWKQAQLVTEKALQSGALAPVATEAINFISDGIDCLGHVVSPNMRKKPIMRQFDKDAPKAPARNPFLPYEPEMYVADVGDQHVCLLNKFPVISPHLLICTKEYAEQTAPLELADLQAWVEAFGENPEEVFGFFNGGLMAGASQPHRHMQLIKSALPLETAILSGELPFEHRLIKLDGLNPQELYQTYLEWMTQLGLLGEECQPYNLLLTSRWMLLVPRVTNQVNQVYANGINFSGRFLVKKVEQLEWLKQFGVLRFLGACCSAD